MALTEKNNVTWGLYGDELIWEGGLQPCRRIATGSSCGESWKVCDFFLRDQEILNVQIENFYKEMSDLETVIAKIEEDFKGGATNEVEYSIEGGIEAGLQRYQIDELYQASQVTLEDLRAKVEKLELQRDSLVQNSINFQWDPAELVGTTSLFVPDRPWDSFLVGDEGEENDESGPVSYSGTDPNKRKNGKSISRSSKKNGSTGSTNSKNNKSKTGSQSDNSRNYENSASSIKSYDSHSSLSANENDVINIQQPQKLVFLRVKLYEPPEHLINGKKQVFAPPMTEFSCTSYLRDLREVRRAVQTVITSAVIQNTKRATKAQTCLPVALCPMLDVRVMERKHSTLQTRYEVAVISPFYNNGSLDNVIDRFLALRSKYSWDSRLLNRNLFHIALSMKPLTEKDIFHRNIKLSNILVSQNGKRLLLSDFCHGEIWMTKLRRMVESVSSTYDGEEGFAAPEVRGLLHSLRSNVFNEEFLLNKIDEIDFERADVFSCGLCLLCLVNLTKVPPKNYSDVECLSRRFRLKFEHISPQLVDAVEQMVSLASEQRPTWKEVARITHTHALDSDEDPPGLNTTESLKFSQAGKKEKVNDSQQECRVQ